MIQNNITLIPDLVHTPIFGKHPTNQNHFIRGSQLHSFSYTSCERTYRCLVDVVHVGGSSAACPDGVLAQGKEVLSSSGQDTALILGGLYSRSLVLSLPGRTSLPSVCASACVHECVSVYVCHLANLSQSPGSDKNAAALRGHTLEWNEVRGGMHGEA